MKMTKKGVIPAPKEEVWTGKCKHCRSEYTASGDELMQEDGNACPPGWRLERARFTVCELCGQRVYFDKLVTRGGMKTKEQQAESLRQGLQEAIDFAEGKPVKAVVRSESIRLPLDDSNKARRRAAAWRLAADIMCCLMILVVGWFIYRSGLKAEGVAIGIMFAAARFVAFYAGEM